MNNFVFYACTMYTHCTYTRFRFLIWYSRRPRVQQQYFVSRRLSAGGRAETVCRLTNRRETADSHSISIRAPITRAHVCPIFITFTSLPGGRSPLSRLHIIMRVSAWCMFVRNFIYRPFSSIIKTKNKKNPFLNLQIVVRAAVAFRGVRGDHARSNGNRKRNTENMARRKKRKKNNTPPVVVPKTPRCIYTYI